MLPITVEVRDRTLARVGVLTDDDLAGLSLFPVLNAVGTWELKLPHKVRDESGKWVEHAMAAALRTPGAGIIATLPGGRRFSGPMLVPSFEESASNTRGEWTFTGVSDLIHLADRRAYPDAAVADEQSSSQSSAYDTRTGAPETLMHGYVSDNIGPTATAERIDSRVAMGTDLGRGVSRTKSARFSTLLELCQELAAIDGLLFDLVQVGDTLEFQTGEPSDLSDEVRMDVHTDGLTAAKYSYSGPRASKVITLGKGEGSDRLIRTRTTADADTLAAEWGRYIEAVSDQRNAEDTAELDEAGDEVLAESGSVVSSLSVTPSDQATRELGLSWWLGDKVTVNTAGVPAKAIVSGIRLKVGPDGLYAGATVGDPVGFSPERVNGSRLSGVESRVSALERTADGGGGTPATVAAGLLVPFGGGVVPDGMLLCDGTAVSRTTYAALFAAIGTTWGEGDGSTTFNLPDLVNRAVIGSGGNYALGSSGGSATHAHTEGDMRAAIGATGGNVNVIGYQAASRHTRGPSTSGAYSVWGSSSTSDARSFNHYTPVYGTTDTASSLQPYGAAMWVITTGPTELPTASGGALTARQVTDLDAAVEPGHYYTRNTAANLPNATDNGAITVTVNYYTDGVKRIRQEFTRNFTNDRRRWTRTSTSDGTAWDAWTQVADGKLLQSGAEASLGNGDTVLTFTVTFPLAFSEPPVVVPGHGTYESGDTTGNGATAGGGSAGLAAHGNIGVYGVTTTGCTIAIARADGTFSTGNTYYVTWHAHGTVTV